MKNITPQTIKRPYAMLQLLPESILLTASLALFWCVIATFPPLRIGIWMDAEGVFIVMNALSAACALSLGGLFFQTEIKLPPAVMLLITFFVAFLVFAGIMTLFATNIHLHLWGLPQTNEGFASYLNYFIMIVSFSVLLQRGHHAALLGNAAIAAIVITLLTVLNHPKHKVLINEDWCPYVFSAFLAFIGIAMLGCVTSIKQHWNKWGMAALGVVIIAISYNKTAQYALVPYGGILLAAHFFKFKITRRAAIIALLCLPFLIIGLELFVAHPTKFVSLDSRVKLLHVVFREFQDHPLRLFTGFGFGHFTDTLLAHFTQIPVALYKSTSLVPDWDSLERIDFHCHHQMIENLLALGIGGALFTLALPLLPIYFARDEDVPFALFYTSLWVTISSTWFTLPIHLPFLALTLCCSAYSGRDIFLPNLTIKFQKKIDNKIGMLISAFMLFVSFMYFRLEGFQTARIYSEHTYSWAAGKINPPATLTSDLIKRHGALQGPHASNYMQTLFQNAKGNPRDLDTQFELAMFKELALTTTHHPLSLRIIMLDILGFERDARWFDYLKETLAAAPARFDLAAPYLATLLNTRKLAEAEQFITMLEGINAKDPIVHWFRGLLMIELGGDLKKARALLKDGLDAGIERWIPVSPTLKSTILG